MSDAALWITPGESVRITRETAEMLEVEGNWAPNGSPPPKHFHPHQDESFEVLAGALEVWVDGEQRTLGTGDTLEIPRGSAHRMWNAGDEPARATWRTSPAGRTAEWFSDIAALRASGRVGKDGMPGPLAFGAYLTEYRDVFRLAGPQPLLQPALAALGLIGRLRGYRPRRPR